MAASIASHVNVCLGLFRSVVDSYKVPPGQTPTEPFIRKIEDERTRFKVWAGNIGAHRKGASSLDYRLRDSSNLHEQVMELLGDLTGLLEDALSIISGEKESWDNPDATDDVASNGDSDSEGDGPETELDQINADVSDVVDCLLRLSVTIRNPVPHDRFYESHATDTAHFEKSDIDHVRNKFTSIDEKLAIKLGKAISRKRQYFRYRQAHNTRLSHGLDQESMDDIDQTIASSIPEYLKQSHGEQQPVPTFDDHDSDAGFSMTSMATTQADSGQRRIPPLPKQAEYGPFQCPFCFRIIVAADRPSWKKHVYSDLRPYLCLSQECYSYGNEYTRRHDWMSHVKQNHWKKYKCPAGCKLSFDSASACQSHMTRTHMTTGGPEEINALISLNTESLAVKDGVPCPLCPVTLRSEKQYQRHVGDHQLQLALFALPDLENDMCSADEKSSSDDTSANDALSDNTKSQAYFNRDGLLESHEGEQEKSQNSDSPLDATLHMAGEGVGDASYAQHLQEASMGQGPPSQTSQLSRGEIQQQQPSHIQLQVDSLSIEPGLDERTLFDQKAVEYSGGDDADSRQDAVLSNTQQPIPVHEPPPKEYPEDLVTPREDDDAVRRFKRNDSRQTIERTMPKRAEEYEYNEIVAQMETAISNSDKDTKLKMTMLLEDMEGNSGEGKLRLSKMVGLEHHILEKAEEKVMKMKEDKKSEQGSTSMLTGDDQEATGDVIKAKEELQGPEKSVREGPEQEGDESETPTIRFLDAVGRKFRFPLDVCKTWPDMEELINQAFLHVDVLREHVQEGRYDLIGPDGEMILPSVWEEAIHPGWMVKMILWPIDRQLRHRPSSLHKEDKYMMLYK